jgi:hypothetical protein
MFVKDAELQNADRDVAPGEDTELTRARKLAERILTLLGSESAHGRHDVRLTRALVETLVDQLATLERDSRTTSTDRSQ